MTFKLVEFHVQIYYIHRYIHIVIVSIQKIQVKINSFYVIIKINIKCLLLIVLL